MSVFCYDDAMQRVYPPAEELWTLTFSVCAVLLLQTVLLLSCPHDKYCCPVAPTVSQMLSWLWVFYSWFATCRLSCDLLGVPSKIYAQRVDLNAKLNSSFTSSLPKSCLDDDDSVLKWKRQLHLSLALEECCNTKKCNCFFVSLADFLQFSILFSLINNFPRWYLYVQLHHNVHVQKIHHLLIPPTTATKKLSDATGVNCLGSSVQRFTLFSTGFMQYSSQLAWKWKNIFSLTVVLM